MDLLAVVSGIAANEKLIRIAGEIAELHRAAQAIITNIGKPRIKIGQLDVGERVGALRHAVCRCN